MTDFSGIHTLGELRPDYFSELLYDEETRLEIHHGERTLCTVEDPQAPEITRPKMIDLGGKKRIRFKVDAVIEKVHPDDVDRGDGNGEDEDGDVEDGGQEDDENINDDGYDTEGKTTFSMGEGPQE